MPKSQVIRQTTQEVLEYTRHVGLGYLESLGCPRQVHLFGDDDKNVEMTNIHRYYTTFVINEHKRRIGRTRDVPCILSVDLPGRQGDKKGSNHVCHEKERRYATER